MCSNYRPVTRLDWLATFFGVERTAQESPPETETWPTGFAPFIRLHDDGSGKRVIDDGHFGLLPHFAKEVAYGRKTYNARSETVHQLPSFRDAWAQSHRCIIPAECVYEMCYESGKAVRWRIQQSNNVPLGLAGIYNQWRDPDGNLHWSFAMLTMNADGHPVFSRMHKPSDEKRMVIILDPAHYDRWLTCTPGEAKTFFKQWPGPLEAFPEPRAPRKRGLDARSGELSRA